MAINEYTRVDNPWQVKDLVKAIKNPDDSKHGKLVIPRFQRGVVWKSERRQDFIDSLKQGFPFGSLLLAETGSKGEYTLIDGLQRTKTILDYSEGGTKYISNDEIRQRHDLLQDIIETINILPEEKKELLVQHIGNWVRAQKNFDAEEFTGFNLAQEVLNRLFNIVTLKLVQDLTPILDRFIRDLKNESDITQVDIPIIIYTGPGQYLPKIFENINSKGTALSRYQIYAATWSHREIEIENKTISNKIREKYDSWVEEGLDVDGYDADVSPKEFSKRRFNIFEYLFGLSKYIVTKKEYRLLFREPKDEADVDPIGFNLCTACLEIKLKEMGTQLPDELIKRLNLGQDRFETALFDAIDFVYGALERFIKPEFNMKKSGRGRKKTNLRRYHSDYQIIDLISTVFRKKYNDQLNVRNSWKESEKKLQKNIPFHYLYDILRRRWVGVKNFGSSDYEREISREAWLNLLDQWFEDNHLKRKEKERTDLRPTDYLFFNYIYSNLMSYGDAHSPTDEFEFDHIVPVKVLQKLIEESGSEGIPINAIANFGLISKDLNNTKKALTIYQYYDKQKRKLDNQELARLEIEIKEAEEFLFTSKDDLDVTELDKENLEIYYVSFLESRFERLKREFCELNGI